MEKIIIYTPLNLTLNSISWEKFTEGTQMHNLDYSIAQASYIYDGAEFGVKSINYDLMTTLSANEDLYNDISKMMGLQVESFAYFNTNQKLINYLVNTLEKKALPFVVTEKKENNMQEIIPSLLNI